ncbi:hypothetical protein OSB04_031212 [Centaurea solstitialis]|uniref:Uncharacterized protein n=1 Tax=Centaurea solstitialis TaxID=347529 RepID=A0AA38SAB1_9ASTR|nr:hypothetical protein OSB04_031212 [Centaurea solstitialis]
MLQRRRTKNSHPPKTSISTKDLGCPISRKRGVWIGGRGHGCSRCATKKTLESMQAQDLMQANFDVTAVMTHVGMCEACFEGLDDKDPEVKKLHEWVTYVSRDALDALQSKHASPSPSPSPKG